MNSEIYNIDIKQIAIVSSLTLWSSIIVAYNESHSKPPNNERSELPDLFNNVVAIEYLSYLLPGYQAVLPFEIFLTSSKEVPLRPSDRLKSNNARKNLLKLFEFN